MAKNGSNIDPAALVAGTDVTDTGGEEVVIVVATTGTASVFGVVKVGAGAASPWFT